MCENVKLVVWSERNGRVKRCVIINEVRAYYVGIMRNSNVDVGDKQIRRQPLLRAHLGNNECNDP